MLISEHIRHLQAIAEQHGDIEVKLDDNGGMSDPIQQYVIDSWPGNPMHLILSPTNSVGGGALIINRGDTTEWRE